MGGGVWGSSNSRISRESDLKLYGTFTEPSRTFSTMFQFSEYVPFGLWAPATTFFDNMVVLGHFGVAACLQNEGVRQLGYRLAFRSFILLVAWCLVFGA